MQCTNSFANLLGYMKSEIIGKKIEILMPEIFKSGHSYMLSNKIKQMNQRHKSDRNSYRENDKKNIFITTKSKMGYIIPLQAKNLIYEDTDFTNSFIIKTYLEAKDTKSTYGYYILTKNDFTICNISSSSIHLGLTMDILNKYVIDIELLIKDKNLENIDFIGKLNEYEEELKEVIWIFPNLIYPKDKISNEIKEEDIPELIRTSPKKKIFIQIYPMKFGESDILGYVFRIVDSASKKKNSEINLESVIPNSNKEILFDLLNLNYIRTEIVKEKKIGSRNLREKEDYNDTKINKSNKNKKTTNISNMEEILDSSEEEKNIKVELTKEKLMELQTKDCKEIENFINQLPYYGEDVFLEKHRPNREKYPIGKGHEALIKISIGNYIKKIEKKINSNPELMKKFNKEKEDENQNNKNMNDINHDFNSDTSASLENLFKSKSLTYIKLISLIFFLIFILIIILEFIFTILNVQKIKDNIVKMKNAYKLLESIGFIKYMITEAVLTNIYKEDYIILIIYKMTLKENIQYLKMELENYSYEFRSIYEDFTSTSISSFSKRYQNFISNNNQVLIYTLTNGIEMTQNITFSIAMTRIPSTVFYVSTLIDESKEINMKERNTYELILNLLNGYYISVKELTLILADDAVESSKTAILSTITFYASFFFVIIFLIIIWHIISGFLIERQRPINLFLTIKKQIFEDLKNASDTFSNKLLNKLMGNEDNEEENQKDYQTNIKEKDINIVKFKAPNENKNKNKNNKKQIRDFIILIIFFLVIEAYIIFKFFYARNYIESVKKFLTVFNITYYSYIDILTNIDLSKSFLYNKTIPIFDYQNSEHGIDKESPFFTMFYSITNSFESMIVSTSNTTSFLSGAYKDEFSQYLYEDFTKLIVVDTYYLPNENLLLLFNKGFKPVVFNIFEKLRFVWIDSYNDKENTINDKRFCDIDFLLLYVVRPWYNKIIEILHDKSSNYLNGARVVQIALFIVVLVFIIFSYFIVWKSYEESLSILLQRSFDLIKLIPEEIKYMIVSKLNE